MMCWLFCKIWLGIILIWLVWCGIYFEKFNMALIGMSQLAWCGTIWYFNRVDSMLSCFGWSLPLLRHGMPGMIGIQSGRRPSQRTNCQLTFLLTNIRMKKLWCIRVPINQDLLIACSATSDKVMQVIIRLLNSTSELQSHCTCHKQLWTPYITSN